MFAKRIGYARRPHCSEPSVSIDMEKISTKWFYLYTRLETKFHKADINNCGTKV